MKMGRFEGMNGYFLKVCLVLFLILSISSFASLGRADDAMVLPKGRWMTSVGFDYYPEWDTQFNDSGEKESLAYPYNVELDDTIFTGVLPTGYSMGRSLVSFEKSAVITNVMLSFALTDKLTLGVKIPYWNFENKVKTALDPNSANVAWNPLLADPNNAKNPGLIVVINATDPNLIDDPFLATALLAGAGFVPAEINAFKLTSNDVIDLLTNVYGYKRFETWSADDLGDIEVGLKYQYLNNEKWRLAFQGGMRLPTGREDDTDNLLDYGFGGGNYDIILGFQNDYLGFENMVLNGTVRYTNQLPDSETLRVPLDADRPITSRKEKVDRDQGDILELELSAAYKFPRGFGINATYNALFKDKDSAKGENGQHLPGLEDETSQTGYTLLLGVSYNNLEKVQKKVAKVPFQVSLSHWQRIKGKNLNKAQYVSLKGALFF